MASNAIKSDFRLSKMASSDHFYEKHLSQWRLNMTSQRLKEWFLSMFEHTRMNCTVWSTNLGNLALCSRSDWSTSHWVTDSTPAFVSGTLVVTHSYLEDWLAQFLITERWTNAVIPFPVSSPRKYSMEPPPPISLKQIKLVCHLWRTVSYCFYVIIYPHTPFTLTVCPWS